MRTWALVLACGAIGSSAIASDRPTTDNTSRRAAAPRQPQTGAAESAGQLAPILVVPTPGGVMIASEDTKALDEFERLLTTMANSLASDDPGVTVFYLKHAKAAAVAQTLEAVLAGGSARITAEPRLNALIVQSAPIDADRIEELLKVLDQRQTPQEVRVQPRPRMIAVRNASSQDIADVVREVYSDRMIGGAARGAGLATGMQGPFQGSFGAPPEAMEQLAMLGGTGGRGGMGALGGGMRASAEDVPRMSIGVNARTNSLVVVAPDAMFREVEGLVGQLDRAAVGSKETVQVFALRGKKDAALLAQAFPALMGDRVRVGQAALAASSSRLPSALAQGRFGEGGPTMGPGPLGPAPGFPGGEIAGPGGGPGSPAGPGPGAP